MHDLAAGILGIGWHLPPEVRGNDFWPEGFRTKPEPDAVGDILAVERTVDGGQASVAPEIAAAMAAFAGDPFMGAHRRHVLPGGADPSDMEASAGREALRAAGVGPNEIDLVIVSSLVPDRLFPSNAPAVQAKCELINATAWGLDVGCASFLAQLESAVGLVRGGLYRRILLVVSSAVSRVLDYRSGVSTIFGDGAAAVVVGALPAGFGLIGHWSRTDGSLREGVVYTPVVDGQPQPRWDLNVGPIRLATLDRAGGKRVGQRSTAFCREACLGALAEAGLSLGDVSLFVANQSVGWLVDACRRTLGLARERAIDTFAEVANIGGAAIPFNLARAQAEGRLRDGDIVLLYSPAAGFTWAASVHRWTSLAPNPRRSR